MKRIAIALALALTGAGVVADDAAETALRSRLPQIFEQAAVQTEGMLARMAKLEQEKGQTDIFPKRINADGTFTTVGPQDWCSGFFPGTLWYLYEATGKESFKAAAIRWTDKLEVIRNYTGNHDIGFMLNNSAGNALRLTGDRAKWEPWLHDAAKALATRYNEKLGLIRSWNNWEGESKSYFSMSYIVIVDNMMNLELLEWDAKHGGPARHDAIARSHANLTDRNHFRPDGSAYHILNYNQDNGKIRGYLAGQGASADGTWARGHAWAVYGFTMMYRETKDPKYLARALKAADYAVNAPDIPADRIPYWDYKAADIPNEPRDASAAAVLASAYLELCNYAPAEKGRAYREEAVKMLTSLASPAYFAPVGENGNFLLMHSTGCKPQNSEVDVPLNYADYYFLEALLRLKKL